jgi:hypothetical protein
VLTAYHEERLASFHTPEESEEVALEVLHANGTHVIIVTPAGGPCHVRGSTKALLVVAGVLDELGLRALAPGTESGFFELSELGVAFSEWQAYRRQVVGE